MFTCRGELSVCVSPLPPYQALLPVFRWPVSRAMSVRNRSIVLRYREAPPLGLPWTGLHAGALWVSPPGSGMLDNPNGPAHPSSGRPPLIFKGRTLVPGFTGNRGRGSAACQAPPGSFPPGGGGPAPIKNDSLTKQLKVALHPRSRRANITPGSEVLVCFAEDGVFSKRSLPE